MDRFLQIHLGPSFGLGQSQGRVDRKAAVGTAVALGILAGAELAWSR
jgi:hypothetical protein